MSEFKSRILVIDDTPVNLISPGAALSDKFDLRIASSGARGLSLALQSPPDLILLDDMMPEMDGYESEGLALGAADYIHKQFNRDIVLHPRMPILALTADAFEDDRQRCLAVGMDDFLTKPISMNALKTALSRWLPAAQRVQAVKPTPAPFNPIDRDAFGALVSALTPLLEQNKFSAINRFKVLQSLVAGTDLEAEVEVLAAQLQGMRFDSVLSHLRHMAINLSP